MRSLGHFAVLVGVLLEACTRSPSAGPNEPVEPIARSAATAGTSVASTQWPPRDGSIGEAPSARSTVASSAPISAPPPPPTARALCSEHVNGGTMHLQWKSFATNTSFEEVAKYYREKSPGVPEEQEPLGSKVPDSITFAYSVDSKVTLYRATSTVKYPECSTKRAASERTVIGESHAIHPR